MLSEFVLCHCLGQSQRFFQADVGRNGFINQLVQAFHSYFLEHLLLVFFADADVAVGQ